MGLPEPGESDPASPPAQQDPKDASTHVSRTGAAESRQGEIVLDADEQRVAQFVLNAVQQNIQNNYNLGLQLPIDDLERLKALDAEAFRLYLQRIERQHESDIFMEEAPLKMSYALARSSRNYALGAILILAVLAGYLAYLGDTGKALAALIAIVVPAALAFLDLGRSHDDDGQSVPHD